MVSLKTDCKHLYHNYIFNSLCFTWMDLCFTLCWLQPLKEYISALWANVLAKHLCKGCQTHHLNPAMSPNSAGFSGNPTYLLFQIIFMERKHTLTYSLLCNSGHLLHPSPDGFKWDHILLRPSGSPVVVSTHISHCICSFSAFKNDFLFARQMSATILSLFSRAFQ